MAEKRFYFQIERTQNLEGFIYAESEEEARELLKEGDFEFDQTGGEDTVTFIEEDK